ncbi:peptidylprolyl isomerase [Helicobacter saguini]|uniref:Peptidyl-prolyl cis-trans isomerase n=1 Tax=Helicobacter saguini TaxID=1548018 RepID=A0A347VPE9_9HELI|nr:peptidylprolyl isomerase [Helicobacter saguini]MWV61392.1 peptidylprolyl isomerase [Helicobacter saguini]MWV67940.1 peptidylprolyl isomerase [Helicobacter saguini]MWV70593.1 peptidylprolyl isomerase [Helicobacter saguini]MWV72497.1 peptidylprolyl isomerase [Helicobacter saguini]TLD94757.1 peptidylprolyl isomerase [Helicobacter saguini]
MEELKTFSLPESELEKLKYAVITTNKGVINIELYPKDAPQAVSNFASLAQSGFYNGLNFHRVIAGFMAQGGDPKGDGTGGPGYRIKCEVENNPHKHLRGTLSMAHAGRDTGGSQFFICFAPQPHLDGQHTAFGRIPVWDRNSLKVLDSIKQGDKIEKIEIKEEIERS